MFPFSSAPRQPLFAVHNNVSLLSINIAPSAFIAALIVAFVFLSLYLPRLPSLPRFGRRKTNKQDNTISRGNEVVVERHRYFVRTTQGLIEIEGPDEGDNSNQSHQFWRESEETIGSVKELEYVDKRPRQLLQYDTINDHGLDAAHRDNYRHKRGSPEKTRKADKESPRKAKQQQQKSFKSAKGSKSSSSSSSTPSLTWPAQSRTVVSTSVATNTSSELVVRHRRQNDSPIESRNDEDNFSTAETTAAINEAAPSSWLPFGTAAGAFGFGHLFATQAPQPDPEPSLDLTGRAMEASEIASEIGPETGNESMCDSDSSAGGYSPPAWRRLENGNRSSGFWRKSDNILGSPPTSPSPSRRSPQTTWASVGTAPNHYQRQAASRLRVSRDSSPGFDSADDEMVNAILGSDDEEYPFNGLGLAGNYADHVLEKAMRTRLPGSESPKIERSPEPWFTGLDNNSNRRYTSHRDLPNRDSRSMLVTEEPSDNYIRFRVRDEQHRNIAAWALSWLRRQIYFMRQTWSHVAGSLLVGLVSLVLVRAIVQPAGLELLPVPDLVKVAGVARSFEPLIYYSENAVAQVGDLQMTAAAVWDLGESVRYSNLTSAPIIVKELDALSETLNTLAMELTRFFANVDSDIDGILIVMDWSRRELAQLTDSPPDTASLPSSETSFPEGASAPKTMVLFRPLAAVYDHLHTLLSSVGVLENAATGAPTTVGAVATTLFGMSGPQRTRTALRRVFHEFLAVLEEAVGSELQHSLALFGLFEAIDGQFLNLQRTVVREEVSVAQAWGAEEEAASTLLARLWTRLLGDSPAHAAAAQAYAQKRALLQSVRQRTLHNKQLLAAHNTRLLALKASLESLRRRLVSPLVRSESSSTVSLEEQIRGLEEVGGYLEGVRTRQKGKLLERMYGTGSVPAPEVGQG